MGKKSNLKGVDKETLEYINCKMARNIEYCDVYRTGILNYKIDVKCKNQKQKEFYLDLKNDKKEICFGVGSAGTGKSMISIWYALEELKKGDKYKRIVIFVPTCEASKTLSLGYLKGTLDEKTEVYNKLIDYDFIVFEFLNFCKGKTYDDSIILVNEAEDFSNSDMLLLLTRIGKNSKLIITGDEKQVSRSDIKNKENSGLIHAITHLNHLEEVAITEFTDDDIVRNELITKILKNW